MNKILLAIMVIGLADFISCKARTSKKNGRLKTIGSNTLSIIGNDLPGIVFVDGCTGTKVGPRHILTAAHCVVSLPQMYDDMGKPVPDPVIPIFEETVKSGEVFPHLKNNGFIWPTNMPKVQFRNAPGDDPRQPQAKRVDIDPQAVLRTFVHPMFQQYMKEKCSTSDTCQWKTNDPAIPDIAVIVLQQDVFSKDEIMTPTPESPRPQDVLKFGGYGCYEGHYEEMKFYDYHKQIGTTRLLSLNDRNKILASAKPEIHKTYEARSKVHYLTEGFGFNRQSASLCPGDSGGPLFIYAGSGEDIPKPQELKLVGINSQAYWTDDYYFDPKNHPDLTSDQVDALIDKGVPAINLHTKLANPEVWGWLNCILDPGKSDLLNAKGSSSGAREREWNQAVDQCIGGLKR